MGASTGRDLHVNLPLTQVALDFTPQGFIADKIAPIVNVNKQSDSYLIWSKADAFRVEDSRRAPGTEANRIYRSVASGTYYAQNYALSAPITDEDVRNADAAYLAKMQGGRTQYVTTKLLLDWEARLGSYLTNTANVGSSSKVSSGWSALAAGNSDPANDIWAAIYNVRNATGYRPNRMVVGEKAWDNLIRNANMVNVLFGTAGGQFPRPRYATIDAIRETFELDDVLVGRAYRNTADEDQSISLTSIWDDSVLIYYAPMNPSIDEPSLMYSFRWDGGLGYGMQARLLRDDKKRCDEVEVSYYQAEKVTAPEMGYLLVDVNSH